MKINDDNNKAIQASNGEKFRIRNPWKRGGVYFRGRMAPWIGDVSNLRPRQKEIVARFTSAAHGCRGTKGVEKGVTKMALCIKKSFGK